MNRAVPIDLPPIISTPGTRSAALTDRVTDQFDLEHDPRYLPGDGCTYCNIWTWDWSRAMSAEVPHWVGEGAQRHETTANALTDWFQKEGFALGWRELRSKGSVLAEVNAGNVVVATLVEAGHGHITPIRPDPSEIVIANVGGHNFQRGPIVKGYGGYLPKCRYWAHP